MAWQPARPGFLRRLPLPGRTESVVLAVLLLAAALLVGLAAWTAGNRTVPEYVPPANAGADAPAAPAPPPAAAPPVLAFYGDWYTAGTPQGGRGPAGWPAIVSGRLGARGTQPHALTDAGYVATSSFGDGTFTSLAEQLPEPDADVTVVFGSRNDYLAPPARITAAALRFSELVRAAAPRTRLLVIGPAWTDADVPPELLAVRDAVAAAATSADATFVDPLAEGWFVGEAGLIGTDGISPTDAGHVYLADRIEPLIRALLADVPAGERPVPTP